MPLVRLHDPDLRPGFTVPKSGIYRAIHEGHRGEHYVTAVRGDEFPACRKCRGEVRFVLWIEAEFVNHDWDFSGPALKLVKK